MNHNQRKAHWQARIDKWRRSPLSIKAFCQAEKIGLASFYHWRHLLYPEFKQGRKCQSTKKAPLFVPVALSSPPLPSSAALKLHFPNGCYVSLSAGFCIETLRPLITLLGGHHVNAT